MALARRVPPSRRRSRHWTMMRTLPRLSEPFCGRAIDDGGARKDRLMKLYHFTTLPGLLGPDGFEAYWSTKPGGKTDATPYADPSSILKVGVRPRRSDDYDGLLQSPMPACVWLTDDPDMVGGCTNTGGDCRLTVVLPASDRRLMRWTDYLRQQCAFDRYLMATATVPKVAHADPCRFYVYFGVVKPRRIHAVEFR
jgi:hypothetical protein